MACLPRVTGYGLPLAAGSTPLKVTKRTRSRCRPGGARRSTLHPGVATIPITGIEPCRVVAVTHADDRSSLTAAFHMAARAWGAQVGAEHPAPAG